MRRSPLTLLALALLAIPSAAVAGSQPKLLKDLSGPANDFAVRPTMMILSGDGSGILGKLPKWVTKHGVGRHFSGPNRGYLTWQFWTASQAMREGYGQQPGAYAYGTYWIDNCIPDCATGSYHSHDAAITAWRTRSGRYTWMQVQYTYEGVNYYYAAQLQRYDGHQYDWKIGSSQLDQTGCGQFQC